MSYIDTKCFRSSVEGRLNRAPFWCTYLLINLGALLIPYILTSVIELDYDAQIFLDILVGFVAFVFFISLLIRRVQDIGIPPAVAYFFIMGELILALSPAFDNESGTAAMAVIDVIYWLLLLVVMTRPGQAGANKWGPNPLEIAAAAQGSSQPTQGAAVQGSVGAPPASAQVCPVCQGSGKNMMGYVCPRCGGSGR